MAKEPSDRPFDAASQLEPVALPEPDPVPLPARVLELEETCVVHAPPIPPIPEEEFAELLRLGRSQGFTKQEIDFALATALIQGRHLSERRLRAVLRGWTSFGSRSLCQFLQQTGVLAREELAAVQQNVLNRLAELQAHASWDQCRRSVARRTSWLLDHLDPGGQVAKLLGVSQIPKMAAGSETRSYLAEYRLIRKLGQGGLGTVWLAVELGLNRYVAIKEISEGISQNATTIARFKREAEITGHLDHPGIVPVHLLGQNSADGRQFYVMRFLGNRTLHDALREYHDLSERGHAQPVAFHQLITAFVGVCHAIAYAHSRGIIHRDLKPQNIALDDFGQVIVLDWGLARRLGQEAPAACLLPSTGAVPAATSSGTAEPDDMDVTLAGQVMGTPLYMAPEQAAGRLDEIDERTDVYGLGAILFAILTGYAPHEMSHESLTATGPTSSLLDLIVDRPLTRPRQLRAKVSRPLEAICLKALQRDRHLRYASVTDLAEDLQRWMANEPITALKDSSLVRARRWIHSHPWLFRWITFVSVLLVAATVTVAAATYQRVAAATHLRIQTALDDTRELKSHLAFHIESLVGNVRFMSTVPPLQEILIAAKPGLPGDGPEERVRQIYSGLLDINPSYAAVNFWLDREQGGGRTIRVESHDTRRGLMRSDLTAFLNRHLPAMASLSRGEIYVGMPGRRVEDIAITPPRGQMPEPVGRCMVAGINLYRANTRVGGVVIEGDLERILRDFLQSASTRIGNVILTDGEGRPMMAFPRARGFRAGTALPPGLPSAAVLQQFFQSDESDEILMVQPKVCIARVPLDRDRSERSLGLIVLFD